MSSPRPLLVLVDSLAQSTREYLMASIATRYDIWLLQSTEPTWEAPYIAGHTVVDTLDAAAMTDAAAGLGAAGVLCWDEVRIEAAAMLAEALGLPGGEPKAIRQCRDKHLTRTALAAAGVPQPASLPAADLAQALAAARRIGYPVVLKPRALTGSYGVVKVESADQLSEEFDRVGQTRLAGAPAYASDVLVEEYADGPEISIDAVCADGEVTPLFTARKKLGFPPYFEETGHIVDAADALPDAPLRRMLTTAHAAVGMITGWTHTEVRLSSRGPRLVEINARIGGDMIPYLGKLATGIDPGLTAAAIACGLPAAGVNGPQTPSSGVGGPSTPPATRCGAAGVAFIYPPHDMVTEQITVDERNLPPEVDTVRLLAVPGKLVCLPPRGHISGRFAFVVVAGPDAASCAHALGLAADAIAIRGAAVGTERP